MKTSLIILFALAASTLMGIAGKVPLNLLLPTENSGLYQGEGPDYFMYTYRNFEGKTSTPWTAGQYGFVRNPVRTSAGILYTRFHEGIDIRPLHRDKRGDPTDIVRTIDRGLVVHTNSVSGRSNYGKYVVVQHEWGYGPFYSLYAHLNRIDVKKGQRLKRGDAIGLLGYTGRGINRERAHLHFEINMLISRRFQSWHGRFFRSPNYHGLYNGLNLVGIDVTRLYKELLRNPNLTIPEFFASQPVHYKVVLPKAKTIDLIKLYPWLVKKNQMGHSSWEISFAQTGVPLAFQSSSQKVHQPTVTYVKPSPTWHRHSTKGYLAGKGSEATLAPEGQRYMRLVTGN